MLYFSILSTVKNCNIFISLWDYSLHYTHNTQHTTYFWNKGKKKIQSNNKDNVQTYNLLFDFPLVFSSYLYLTERIGDNVFKFINFYPLPDYINNQLTNQSNHNTTISKHQPQRRVNVRSTFLNFLLLLLTFFVLFNTKILPTQMLNISLTIEEINLDNFYEMNVTIVHCWLLGKKTNRMQFISNAIKSIRNF